MKCVPEENDPFSFDGPEIFQSKGTEIQWKEGQNVTAEKREVDGEMQNVKVQSFFNFFSPPELLEDPNHPLFEEINVCIKTLKLIVSIFCYIFKKIISHINRLFWKQILKLVII